MFSLNLNHCLGKNKDAEYTKQSSNTEVLKRGDVSNIFRTSHICEEHHLFDKAKFISRVVYTKRIRLIKVNFSVSLVLILHRTHYVFSFMAYISLFFSLSNI